MLSRKDKLESTRGFGSYKKLIQKIDQLSNIEEDHQPPQLRSLKPKKGADGKKG